MTMPRDRERRRISFLCILVRYQWVIPSSTKKSPHFLPMSQHISYQWANTFCNKEPPHFLPVSLHIFYQWASTFSTSEPTHFLPTSHNFASNDPPFLVQWATTIHCTNQPSFLLSLSHNICNQTLIYLFGERKQFPFPIIPYFFQDFLNTKK